MREKVKISYQVIILAMSLYVLFALGVETLFDLDDATRRILHTMDLIVCFVFFYDFCYNLKKAKSKREYLKWGWLDFLSSIPIITPLHYAGVARVVRIIKLLRGLRSLKQVVKYIMTRRKESAFWAVLVSLLTLIQFSSIGILHFEQDVNAMINSPEDALWWSFVTITTVGYGDIVPVTSGGRVIAAILMSFGVGVFSLLTGFAASWFLGHDMKMDRRILKELDQLKKEIREKSE